jgi:dihydrolipoamide dehydrogenase
VQSAGNAYTVLIRDVLSGDVREITAEAVMVAAGRKSNADLLKIENAGIETDKTNFIKVDEYLKTNRKNIWAVGDATGKAMFTHAGDKEAELAWHNATHRKKIRMDFQNVPYAVFTWPQIASIGLTEEQARKDHEILVGRALYSDTVMGEAMVETEGFATSMLIQEVVNALLTGADVNSITRSMHIFPALSNIIPETFNNLE